MGRFDLAWDGQSDPKMLEYNADTPSILLESGPVQKEWFDQKYGSTSGRHQSNYIDPILVDAMKKLSEKCKTPAFGQVSQDDENTALMIYLAQTYKKATGNRDN